MEPKQLQSTMIRFDDFEADLTRRRLMRNGERLVLNARTFDLLAVLLQRAGDVVTKDELLSAVWPDQFVEEGNLTVHISSLRKALGERRGDHRFIITVPGRGHQFVGHVSDAVVDGVQ